MRNEIKQINKQTTTTKPKQINYEQTSSKQNYEKSHMKTYFSNFVYTQPLYVVSS